MAKVVSVGTTEDYSSAKMMKFLMKFPLPLVKDKKEEYYSFLWSSWTARGHIILFFGLNLVFAALNIYFFISVQIQAMDLFGNKTKSLLDAIIRSVLQCVQSVQCVQCVQSV